jgi:arsenate reductase
MKLRILFLCTGNSCRSQMAEGWAHHLKAATIDAFSAGVEKHGINPLAVRVMAEAGVDISAQQSRLISELPCQEFDYVITLCANAQEACPYFPARIRIIHRGFDDPPKLAAAATSEEERLAPYRRVRDEIRAFVVGLPGTIDESES